MISHTLVAKQLNSINVIEVAYASPLFVPCNRDLTFKLIWYTNEKRVCFIIKIHQKKKTQFKATFVVCTCVSLSCLCTKLCIELN